MKAKIEELKGKYYGTIVEIFEDDGGSAGHVVIWLNPGNEKAHAPSERELQEWNDWQANEFPDQEPDEYEICDNHYETTMAYEVAKKLVEAINND